MPGSDDATERIKEMLLILGNEKAFDELENTLRDLDQREQMLNDTLEELLQEVDELLDRLDMMDESDRLELKERDRLC